MTAAFFFLRAAERLIPLDALYAILFIPAFVLSLAQRKRRARLQSGQMRLPQFFHTPSGLSVVYQLACAHASRFLTFWPDRLVDAPWRARCQLTGDTTGMAVGARAVLFVSLHFGPCILLPYWLRASGYPIAVVSGSIRDRSALRHRRHRFVPFPDIPFAYGVEELRTIRQHLTDGGQLLIFIDVPRGKQLRVPFDDATLRLATGVFRLAAATGAVVIPCLIVQTDSWKYSIHFGATLPAALLKAGDFSAAAGHCVEQWRPVMRQYPEQCEPDLLQSIERSPEPPPKS